MRWDADHGGDKDVQDCVQTFLISTQMKDLLTDKERKEGDEKLLAFATKKLAAVQVIGLPFFTAWSFFINSVSQSVSIINQMSDIIGWFIYVCMI